jgi:molybdenum cofactor biosynthesis protein MoaC
MRKRALQNLIKRQIREETGQQGEDERYDHLTPEERKVFQKQKASLRRAQQRVKRKEALLRGILSSGGSEYELKEEQHPFYFETSLDLDSMNVDEAEEVSTNASTETQGSPLARTSVLAHGISRTDTNDHIDTSKSTQSQPRLINRERKQALDALLRRQGLKPYRGAGNRQEGARQVLARQEQRELAEFQRQREELAALKRRLERKRSFLEYQARKANISGRPISGNKGVIATNLMRSRKKLRVARRLDDRLREKAIIRTKEVKEFEPRQPETVAVFAPPDAREVVASLGNVSRGARPKPVNSAGGDRRSWITNQQHELSSTRPRTSTEISKYALAKALQFGGGSLGQRPRQISPGAGSTSGRRYWHHDVRLIQRGGELISREKDREAQIRHWRKSKELDEEPTAAERLYNQKREARRAKAAPPQSGPEIRDAGKASKADAHPNAQQRGQKPVHELQQLNISDTNGVLAAGELLNAQRRGQVKIEKLNKESEVTFEDDAIQPKSHDSVAATGSVLEVDDEVLYEAFMHPFQVNNPSGDWRNGPRDHDNVNPKKHLLRQLRFLERRFDPAFDVLRSLFPRWRQEIWHSAIGLREDEPDKVGQLTILRETLGRIVQDSIRRRTQGQPRLREDPLWSRIVENRWVKKEQLSDLGLNEEEVFVWWHVKKKFRAHIERNIPLSDTRKKLNRFLADAKARDEERARSLLHCFSRGEHLLSEWEDVARNVQRELWMFAMGVDPENMELKSIVKSDISIGIEDLRAAMDYWVSARDNWLPRPEAWSRGYLLRMKEKLRNGADMQADVFTRRRLALQRADKRLLGIGSHDARQILPQPSDNNLKSGAHVVEKSMSHYLPHSEYRIAQKLMAVERTIDRIGNEIQGWRRELFAILKGVPFENLNTHQYVPSQFLQKTVESRKQKLLKNMRPKKGLQNDIKSKVETELVGREQAIIMRKKMRQVEPESLVSLSSKTKPLNAQVETQSPTAPPARTDDQDWHGPFNSVNIRQYRKNLRKYEKRLQKAQKLEPPLKVESQHDVPEELFELPHEVETRNRTAPPQIIPTSRLLAPLRRMPDYDVVPEKVEGAVGKNLTHLNSSGEAHMVSVAAKPDTKRIAIAVGQVHFSRPETYELVTTAAVKKGDVLSVSRIAGIQAAKMCPSIIPLCHPIMISSVTVDVVPFKSGGESGIRIEGKVECTGPTGVEMEALTAVMGAALTVIDMIKAIDKAASIEGVKVVFKSGGKSGNWIDEEWSTSKKDIWGERL